MLAVHGLPGDTEPGSDVLPGPPERPGIIDLENLQPLGERPQGRRRTEPDVRVGAGGTFSDLECRLHDRQHTPTIIGRQHMLTIRACPGPALASTAALRPPPLSRRLQLGHITQRQDSVEGGNPGAISESRLPGSQAGSQATRKARRLAVH